MMLKKIFQVLLFAALLAGGSVASFAADKPCWEQKAECLEYIRERAMQGNMRAQYRLALMYNRGAGVAKDPREAAVWFRAAAEQGNRSAPFLLGVIYDYGSGVRIDKHEAYVWYSIANTVRKGKLDDKLTYSRWKRYLTPAEIESAKREAAKRLVEIEYRRNYKIIQ